MVESVDRATGFDAVYRARRDHLLRLALLLTGDRDVAEDAVADAVARTWARWDRGEITDPEAYLRRAVVNAVTDGFRSRGRRRRREERRDRDGRDAPDVADQVARRTAVLEALDRLTPEQRAVLVLRYFDDRTEAETAALLDVSIGTVKSRAARALPILAALLREGTDG